MRESYAKLGEEAFFVGGLGGRMGRNIVYSTITDTLKGLAFMIRYALGSRIISALIVSGTGSQRFCEGMD